MVHAHHNLYITLTDAAKQVVKVPAPAILNNIHRMVQCSRLACHLQACKLPAWKMEHQKM